MLPFSDSPPFFHLKPIQVARVSEISETTAAAPVSAEERINFHIGNPLQDTRLSSTFLRIALGIDVHQEVLHDADPAAILDHLGWQASDLPGLDFLIRTIQKSSPYMPRGGYSRKSPHALIQAFCSWLTEQQEPLRYDTGEQSGRREIILASGGFLETLRIFLFSLSNYLEILPARILCYRCRLFPAIRAIPNLIFEDLSADEYTACEQIEHLFLQQPETPTFLLIGDALEEITRRNLRTLSIAYPLFFIEANNAANNQSLAREAKLEQRVIRLLTPAIFDPRLDNLSTVFVAGNANFLNVLENVQFNLKGTPSASEVEFLIFLLEQKLTGLPEVEAAQVPPVEPPFEGLTPASLAAHALPDVAGRVEHNLAGFLDAHTATLASSLDTLEETAVAFSRRVQNTWQDHILDEFASLEAKELLDQLVRNCHRQDWCQALLHSFLSAFTRHQPQYDRKACLVTSGSSRTALAILGLHCGISEVVIPDLSWSYEQCFPVIHAVPLTESLELDEQAIIAKVQELCQGDPDWPQRGAVVVNNPHNATGRIFNEHKIRRMVAYCLQHEIPVIDDLAYQNVAPVEDLPAIKTVRQLAAEMERAGEIDEFQAEGVITVHSMSKTDCLAGARLAVVEIRHQPLRQRFEAVNSQILPNIVAVFICYLFYRNSLQAARTYWRLRNALFRERTLVLLKAVENLPPDRNPFDLNIIPPAGSMYPLLQIKALPAGLSLEWLASSLARRGIGLLPLATFARTEDGFETGRTAFRLTLGGLDTAGTLAAKTRRLLIDLNRLIAEEDARYNRNKLTFRVHDSRTSRSAELLRAWEDVARQVRQACTSARSCRSLLSTPPLDDEQVRYDFFQHSLPERLESFRTRLLDHTLLTEELTRLGLSHEGCWLADRLEREFMKDSLQRRQDLFRMRSYDRTVHPTQMFSLAVEGALDRIITALIANKGIAPSLVENAAQLCLREYLGLNVAITSQQEAGEILLELSALTAAEDYTELFTSTKLATFLSFWSDWDGSNRPSGQGHRLVASLVMENVQRMADILKLLQQVDPTASVSPELLAEVDEIPQRNQRFTRLLDDITRLTQQLEGRYRSVLPYSLSATPMQRLATNLHLRRDPVKVLWQHNDRYEQNMLELRHKRRANLESYFALNKRLRKQLYALIPAIQRNRFVRHLLQEVVGYHDILQRAVITPRIQQGMVTARDQFAIDTTVFNLNEINAIAGKYGNPGMTLALQVSLSSKAGALIAIDRKMHTQLELIHREDPSLELSSIWLIPLFEDVEAVKDIPAYLDDLWEYATQSHSAAQSVQARFSEILNEIFIAGSDLSQQISQAAGAFLYRKAKYEIQTWLAEHGLAESVRIKIGSGEPMQRQGAYYSRIAGESAFSNSTGDILQLSRHLPPATLKSTAYAVTPLQGVFLGGDLRTFQSNLSEQLRSLPVQDYVSLLVHVRESQKKHRNDLIRAAETIAETRLGAQSRGRQELERLTIGTNEAFFEQFQTELTENFRHILYGRQEDVVGIHIISYFIGRSIPQLRDRPTSRKTLVSGSERGHQILANIAEIIPLAQRGSLLRAISHNQAQTAVLGINQLTTGLFRALQRFAQKAFPAADQERLISERLLPNLPVYEILHTLRLYQDWRGEFLRRIENAFPAGNSAFVALREDHDAMLVYLPLLQRDLLRRHGVNVTDFFKNGFFIPELLPTVRPDLAVLLQQNLFNTELENLFTGGSGKISAEWQTEVDRLLHLPGQIRNWRSIIWDVIGESTIQRVQSFSELAVALYAFSSNRATSNLPLASRGARLSPMLSDYFRAARADDEMRNFLLGAIEYLNSTAEGSLEMPVSIIRAMNDVERIAQIEESVLPPEKQNLVRCCVLQIARLAGENG
jgi:aspartate/methionine/tyrosine aminotransferase